MRYVIMVQVLAAIVGCAVPASMAGRAADKTDRELPEPETFLLLATQEMNQYHAYARDWYRLGFAYAYPNYHLTDADIRPRPSDKNRWCPRGSHFTYVIAEATNNTFLIQAVGDDNKGAYEMRENVSVPNKVP